jgi:hypothetical protein
MLPTPEQEMVMKSFKNNTTQSFPVHVKGGKDGEVKIADIGPGETKELDVAETLHNEGLMNTQVLVEVKAKAAAAPKPEAASNAKK